MFWIPFTWIMTILSLLFTGIMLNVMEMNVQHLYTQANLDAATLAGSSKTEVVVDVTTDEIGTIFISRFVLDDLPAMNVAQRTFDKNMAQFREIGIDIDSTAPIWSFPDEQTIRGDVNVHHEFDIAKDTIENMFNTVEQTVELTDPIYSESSITRRR